MSLREKIINLLMWPTFSLSTTDAQAGFIMAAIESEPAAGEFDLVRENAELDVWMKSFFKDGCDAEFIQYCRWAWMEKTRRSSARIASLEADLAALSALNAAPQSTSDGTSKPEPADRLKLTDEEDFELLSDGCKHCHHHGSGGIDRDEEVMDLWSEYSAYRTRCEKRAAQEPTK